MFFLRSFRLSPDDWYSMDGGVAVMEAMNDVVSTILIFCSVGIIHISGLGVAGSGIQWVTSLGGIGP